MKTFLLSALCLASFSATAADLASTLKSIEVENNAKCTQVSRSTDVCFGKSAGIQGTCFYSLGYSCVANSGTFNLKLKMKNSKVRSFKIIQ